MNNDRFRLETLLTIRKKKEEDCEAALALALADLKRSEEALFQIRQEREEIHQDWQKKICDPKVRCEQLRDYEDYAQVLEAHEIDALNRLKASKEKQQAATAALLKASRDVKILEKLKKRVSERLRKVQMTREQNQLDEFATLRHEADSVA